MAEIGGYNGNSALADFQRQQELEQAMNMARIFGGPMPDPAMFGIGNSIGPLSGPPSSSYVGPASRSPEEIAGGLALQNYYNSLTPPPLPPSNGPMGNLSNVPPAATVPTPQQSESDYYANTYANSPSVIAGRTSVGGRSPEQRAMDSALANNPVTEVPGGTNRPYVMPGEGPGNFYDQDLRKRIYIPAGGLAELTGEIKAGRGADYFDYLKRNNLPMFSANPDTERAQRSIWGMDPYYDAATGTYRNPPSNQTPAVPPPSQIPQPTQTTFQLSYPPVTVQGPMPATEGQPLANRTALTAGMPYQDRFESGRPRGQTPPGMVYRNGQLVPWDGTFESMGGYGNYNGNPVDVYGQRFNAPQTPRGGMPQNPFSGGGADLFGNFRNAGQFGGGMGYQPQQQIPDILRQFIMQQQSPINAWFQQRQFGPNGELPPQQVQQHQALGGQMGQMQGGGNQQGFGGGMGGGFMDVLSQGPNGQWYTNGSHSQLAYGGAPTGGGSQGYGYAPNELSPYGMEQRYGSGSSMQIPPASQVPQPFTNAGSNPMQNIAQTGRQLGGGVFDQANPWVGVQNRQPTMSFGSQSPFQQPQGRNPMSFGGQRFSGY